MRLKQGYRKLLTEGGVNKRGVPLGTAFGEEELDDTDGYN